MDDIMTELQKEIDKIKETLKNDTNYSTIRFYDDNREFKKTVENLEDNSILSEDKGGTTCPSMISDYEKTAIV